jgi:hypothetical protein
LAIAAVHQLNPECEQNMQRIETIIGS